MGANYPGGAILIPGACLSDLCREPYKIAAYLIFKICVLWLQRRRIFHAFSYYKPMADIDDHGAWPLWTPGAWLAGFMKGIISHDCCT